MKTATIKKIIQSKKLGGYSEEILSQQKVVICFSKEEEEVNKYEKMAKETSIISFKADTLQNFIFTAFRVLMFSFYAYAFWIGSKMILGKIFLSHKLFRQKNKSGK